MKGFRLAVALAVASLVGAVASLVISPAFAQASQGTTTIVTTTDGTVVSESSSKEVILSGESLALRVERTEKGLVVGVLVARVKGQWVPVQLSNFNTLAR
ncbi:MAG: hypothetical protein NDJ92_13510 [Thermoanaerobaculia bacterium]|nr:hypothetical protein [Thermoanaerobaculia bacterium]